MFQGSTEAGQDQAKRLMLYGIAALVIMLSLWGIVNMVSGAFGIGRGRPICPDFNPNCFSGGSGQSTSQTGARFFDITNPGAGVQTAPKGTLKF